jgi:hypothetical protein
MADRPMFIDGISSFEMGMNSGIAPILLKKNQLSFANNCTVRGAFVTHRPAYRKIPLTFSSAAVQAAFEGGLWQGGCYYKPDSGDESMFISISGRQYNVVPSASNAFVYDKTISGDLNNVSAPIAWHWQAERWVIVNDGIDLPIFFDGISSRRSANIGFKITVKNLTDVAGSTQVKNTPVSIQGASTLVPLPNYIAASNLTRLDGVIAPGNTVRFDWGVNIIETQISVLGYLFNFVSSTFDTFLHRYIVLTTALNALAESQISSSQPVFGVRSPESVNVGSLVSDFVAPVVGGTVDIFLNTQYSSGIGEVVTINSKTYEVAAIAAAAITELPAGRMGVYGLGRNWMSLTDGRNYIGSDMVGYSGSGTIQYNYRDAIFKTTENAVLNGGGSFIIPQSGGEITAMVFATTLDTSLGQGPLQVFTTNSVFSCNAPMDRTTWQTLENPIQTQSLVANGAAGQDSTIAANSDIIFQSTDANLWSLTLARREISTWGNTPVSREISRIVEQDDVELLDHASAVEFSNRRLSTSKPIQSIGGVYHSGLSVLNFDPLSTMSGKYPSVYDGLWTGINTLKVIVGKFSKTSRCFVFGYNTIDQKIELYEILKDDAAIVDNNGVGDKRITWSFETACLFQELKGKNDFDTVQLQDGEMRLANVIGRVDYSVYYRPQFSPCWTLWKSGQICADGLPQNRISIGFGRPSGSDCDPANNRPLNTSESFQFKFVITGSAKFYGAQFKASMFPKPEFEKPICGTTECITLECDQPSDYDLYTLEDVAN